MELCLLCIKTFDINVYVFAKWFQTSLYYAYSYPSLSIGCIFIGNKNYLDIMKNPLLFGRYD